MPGKGNGGQPPGSEYIGAVQRQQAPAAEFSVNWLVKDLLEKLLLFHLHEDQDVPESDAVAAMKQQGKCPSKSPTSLGPSARKTRSSLRIFFSSSE